MFTTHNMSHVTFVTCHMSCVTCFFFLLLFLLDKVVKLNGGGSVINKPTPSSLYTFHVFNTCYKVLAIIFAEKEKS